MNKRKRVFSLIIIFILAFQGISFGEVDLNGHIVFENDILKDYMETLYDLDGIRGITEWEAAIHPNDRLHIDGFGIDSLEGLQYFTNLNIITANANPIADLSPLSGLSLFILEVDPGTLNGPGTPGVIHRTDLDFMLMSGQPFEVWKVYGILPYTPITNLWLENEINRHIDEMDPADILVAEDALRRVDQTEFIALCSIGLNTPAKKMAVLNYLEAQGFTGAEVSEMISILHKYDFSDGYF